MRYIIIDPKDGVFLGTAQIPETGDYRMLFSANNIYEITKSTAWTSREDAEHYMQKYVKKFCPFSYVVEIDCNEDFADVVDIVKSGYGEFTHDMLDFMPLYSELIH